MRLVNLEPVNASVLPGNPERVARDRYRVSGNAATARLGELIAKASIVGRADLLPAAPR